MSLPSFIYVTEEDLGEEENYLIAHSTKVGAVEGSAEEEPITVGTYKLVETNKLKIEKTAVLMESGSVNRL